MRIPISLILTVITLIVIGCQTEKTEEVEQLKQTADEAAPGSSSLPALSDDYLVSIYEAQELIKIEQDNQQLREAYCQKAYFKDQGLFISMGIARKHNPETGQPISPSLVERAAQIDAMRWASYGKQWLDNNFEPPFGHLDATYNHSIEIIDRANVGDSLFLFIATRF